MKLKQKAYKAAFPNLFDLEGELWKDESTYDIIYGKSQKEAVREYCMHTEFNDYFELKCNIRTRRFKQADLYGQQKSKALIGLSEPQIHQLTHSLGVEIGDKCPVKFYRDFSVYYDDHEECEKLVAIGLMTSWNKFQQKVYKVTDSGKEAVKTLLLITKNQSK
jgi:hypothetical protein